MVVECTKDVSTVEWMAPDEVQNLEGPHLVGTWEEGTEEEQEEGTEEEEQEGTEEEQQEQGSNSNHREGIETPGHFTQSS